MPYRSSSARTGSEVLVSSSRQSAAASWSCTRRSRGGGEVDVADGNAVQAEPARRRWCGQERGALLDEPVGVGVVQRGREPVDHQPVDGADAGRCGDAAKVAAGVGDEHGVVRCVAGAQVVDDGRDDRQHDALLHADEHDGGGGEQCDHELVAADREDLPHADDVDKFDADQEHDGRKDRQGQVGQRPGQEQQYQQHDEAGGELGELAATAGAVDHLRLGGTAVDDEGAGNGGGGVGQTQTDQVHVLVQGLVVLAGVGA